MAKTVKNGQDLAWLDGQNGNFDARVWSKIGNFFSIFDQLFDHFLRGVFGVFGSKMRPFLRTFFKRESAGPSRGPVGRGNYPLRASIWPKFLKNFGQKIWHSAKFYIWGGSKIS